VEQSLSPQAESETSPAVPSQIQELQFMRTVSKKRETLVFLQNGVGRPKFIKSNLKDLITKIADYKVTSWLYYPHTLILSMPIK